MFRVRVEKEFYSIEEAAAWIVKTEARIGEAFLVTVKTEARIGEAFLVTNPILDWFKRVKMWWPGVDPKL